MSIHLQTVSRERKYYQNSIQITRVQFNSNNTATPNSCMYKATVHYSFDMAQQIHIPSNPLQPGPIFFFNSISRWYIWNNV